MPRKQLPKETILDAALQVIIRDGHEKMNIKTVAVQLGRSTQTISWAFGNMEAFRDEVFGYALQYANRKVSFPTENPIEEYGAVGVGYIRMAYETPNLIRFLHADEKKLQAIGGLGGSFDPVSAQKRRAAFAKQFGCTEEVAGKFMETMLIYSHGLVSMILQGGIQKSLPEVLKMLNEIGADLMHTYISQRSA